MQTSVLPYVLVAVVKRSDYDRKQKTAGMFENKVDVGGTDEPERFCRC